MEGNIEKIGEVYIILDLNCGLKCRICPYWGKTGACYDKDFSDTYSKKVDIPIVKRFIDDVKKYNPSTINISGGDPLLDSNWVEIAKYIKESGMKVTLSTNGRYLSKYFDEIIQYVDELIVSFKGTKDILSSVTAPYDFDGVVDGIKRIGEYSSNNRKIFIRVIYVISQESYHRMKEFYNHFLQKGVFVDNFYFQHVMYITKEDFEENKKIFDMNGMGSTIWRGFYNPQKDIDFNEFFQQLEYINRFDNATFSPKLTNAEIQNYYNPTKKDLVKRTYTCKAPWNQIDLYPNGDIMICPDYIIGNITKESFDKIWSGKKAEHLRDMISTKKALPSCNSCFYYYVGNEHGGM